MHQFVSALLCSWLLLYLSQSLNWNTNFKINFVCGICDSCHLAIGTTTKLFTVCFSNLKYLMLHVFVVPFFINDLKQQNTLEKQTLNWKENDGFEWDTDTIWQLGPELGIGITLCPVFVGFHMEISAHGQTCISGANETCVILSHQNTFSILSALCEENPVRGTARYRWMSLKRPVRRNCDFFYCCTTDQNISPKRRVADRFSWHDVTIIIYYRWRNSKSNL